MTICASKRSSSCPDLAAAPGSQVLEQQVERVAILGPAASERAIAALLRDRAIRRGAQLRLVPTRANGQPAYGVYLADAHAAITRAYALIVLTLQGDRISAMTWFGDLSVFPHFGLPRTLPD